MTTPQQPHPPAPRKSIMPAWGWILIAVGACVVLCCGGILAFTVFAGKSIGDNQNAANADVRIPICAPDPSTGWMRAAVSVVNSDSRPHDYFVSVAFERGGTQLGTGFIIVNDLAVGQSAVDDAVALGKEGSGYTCRVTKVTRT